MPSGWKHKYTMVECALFCMNLRIRLVNSEARKRTTFALLAAVVVVVIVYFLIPAKVVSPTGVLLPSGKTMAPISADNVNFMDTAPLVYQTVGKINVMLHSLTATPQNQAAIVHYTKKLAAKAGANGIILTALGYISPDEDPILQGAYILQGKAIHYAPNG